jgi:hypothetical protein
MTLPRPVDVDRVRPCHPIGRALSAAANLHFEARE